MDYDYGLYKDIIVKLMESSWRDPEDLEIGRDISDIAEVKIMFDGYGDLEEEVDGEYRYEEGGNKNMESYAVFIHKDALNENFVFPEHDSYAFTFGSLIQHRPAEEVCIFVWYDVELDEWEVIQLEYRIDSDSTMNEKDVMTILEGLNSKYYDY